MNNKEKAYWLSDKIPAYGDYAAEASILLKSQADEIERCQSWIKDLTEQITVLRAALEDIASGELGINLCVKVACQALKANPPITKGE